MSTSAKSAPATLSQSRLILRRFGRHRLAVYAARVIVLLGLTAIFAECVAPWTRSWRDLDHAYCPPQPLRWNWRNGLHVRALRAHVDPVTLRRTYVVDESHPVPLRLWARGEPYRLWGLIPWDRHLLGVDLARWRASGGEASGMTPTFYLLGADRYGRDLFSRIAYGARISLSVGLFGICLSFALGCTLGGISGYVGGATDMAIQRLIEVINSVPRLPLWLAFAAVMPGDWSPLKTYFAITVVLSLLGWPGLARVVRGRVLALREEDYVTAAYLMGALRRRIIFVHLIPGVTSHIIVSLTMSIPGMILGETSLSFLGLGLRPPVVSWGVLLQDCMNVTAVTNYPWLLMPAAAIVVTVLAFNFVGDGLRDAADPYSSL